MIDRIIAATPVYSTPAAKPHRYVLVERILTINMPGDSLKKGDIMNTWFAGKCLVKWDHLRV